jgi:hypothetical protein
MEDKGAQPGMIETQLPAWAAELERLEAKAENSWLGQDGGAWEDVKTGATRAWDELRPALERAISKFT